MPATGNPYNKWMKRNSGDATKGAQNFHLTGQTPQGLMGLEANFGHPYTAGSGFPVGKHGGGYNSNRLQNAINSNRNRYFQHQFVNEMPESMSNRMLQGIQGGQFNSMDQQQQYGANRFYMNGNRRVPRSFKPPSAHGVPFDSMLPNISGQFDMPDDLNEEEGNYRYKYNNKSKQDSDEYNTVDLIGKYAKYYHAQEYQNEQNKQMKAVPTSNNKNNELVSRYLKHAAKKQVRSTSISVPKYTGDYDPDVFVTGKLQSDENISQSSLTQSKQPSQEEINRESLFNKQEAATEQKFRLEKANFPAPSSLNNATSTDNNSEKAKYKLKYTKRKKMVIASTSDKENDPSMLVKGGGDEVTLGNDDEVPTPTEEEKAVEFTTETEKPIVHEEIIEQAAAVRVPTAKKIIKKMRRQSVTTKLVPEKEAEKKVEVLNKQQPEPTNKPKATKTVDIRKQIKRVTIEKVKRSIPVVATKNEEQPTDNKEKTEENDNLQSTIEEQLPYLENDSYHIVDGGSEEELQFTNDEDDEKLAQQKADEELNAILAPLRAQVPDHIRISPTLGFLPIMPVTFSWFPMSQQHKEAFQKMSEQSKFPNSLRPFQRFAAT